MTVKAWPFFLNFSQEKEREKREIVAPTVMEHCGTPGMSWKPESSADARKMEIFSLPLLFFFLVSVCAALSPSAGSFSWPFFSFRLL